MWKPAVKRKAINGKAPAKAVPHTFNPKSGQQRNSIQNILRSTGAQAKLTIGQPNDKYEQEADRVADQVMRMSDADVAQRVSTGTVQPMRIQRIETSKEEEEKVQAKSLNDKIQRQEEEAELQAKEQSGQTPQVSAGIESRINSLKGGGKPLDSATRSFFESRMGADFSDVRLHSNAEDANLATSIGARAFTIGNHIAVGGGEYNFHSPQGKKLMAHELTHVLQQKQSQNTVYRNPLAALGAAEWLAAAALGYVVTQDAVKSSTGDISWKLDEMSGVLLPGGSTDVAKYKKENPGLTVQAKELSIAFWRGTEGSRKAGVKIGLAFNTDGKGIGNVSARIIDTYDWPLWGAKCTVDLMPQTFVSANGKAVIRVTLTNSWDNTLSNGVDSGIWNLEGDGSFSEVRSDGYLYEAHSLS